MNIEEMVIEYLKTSKFDGLYNEVCECGCGKDEINPSNCIDFDCFGAYKNKCNVCREVIYSPEKGKVTCGDCIESLETLG